MIVDYARFAFNSITHRKLRSWLTIIGIIIGIASIIALISLSQGLQNSIEAQFASFGPDRILVSAKNFQGPGSVVAGITEKDVNTLKRMGSFRSVSPALSRQAQFEYKNKIVFSFLFSLPASEYLDSFADFAPKLEAGRQIKQGDKYVIVIGHSVANDMFDKEIRVNNRITINGKKFTVIGIQKESGNRDEDSQIATPLEAAREILNEPTAVDFIITRVKLGQDVEAVAEKMKKELERSRDDENFEVNTPKEIAEQINQILGVMQAVLVGIAAISLLVGGIGIMNSMYTSVLERTKDIGIMKSIGARNSDVLWIFILEAAMVGFVGGFFGILLGLGISLLVGEIAGQAGFPLLIKPSFYLMLFGLFFAIIVGIISGVLPAIQAAKLKPVDALRYE
ncbi:MAG TPA: ABC transporter permease [Candidatus Nanoarchaeia archaeon]|nr:ABC transporter permease [Candidatus Nanoarchaeia archaeon]